MKLPRRHFLELAAGAASVPVFPRITRAQAYPRRSVRIVVGFPAGGTADLGARLAAQWLSERFAESFLVENRPGAATNIAAELVVRAPANGYTLLMATGANAVNATLYGNLDFNFIRDIAPVAGINRSPFVLEVHPAVPVQTVSELINYAKAHPGKLNMGSLGTGTGSHLGGELFKMRAGVEMLHVPYRGSAPMLVDLISGQVQVAFDNLPSSIEHIRSGKLRALAVTTAARSHALPDIPTLAEVLPGFEASAWQGIGAPRGTPNEIIDKLNETVNAGLAEPGIRAQLAALGATVLALSPAGFGKLIADETEKWGKVIRAANIKPE
jgi:tripartite-type tricarboxylate transporter receptor subunit TctC